MQVGDILEREDGIYEVIEIDNERESIKKIKYKITERIETEEN